MLTPFPVVHGESAPFLAYRVEGEDRVIAYTPDTEWDAKLPHRWPRRRPFHCEAYYDEKVVKNHLSLETLEAHLAESRPKRLVLTPISSDDMLGRLIRSATRRRAMGWWWSYRS